MLDNPADTAESVRFGFGRNWLSFIDVVDEARIGAARDSLLKALRLSTLSGRTFLDIGCGSGLFSLAASRLGAHVRSFDYDQDSVMAATGLRRRFAPDSDWHIERGSILDPDFTAGLGLLGRAAPHRPPLGRPGRHGAIGRPGRVAVHIGL
jgi:SAM-dependent methyltransferase